MRYIYVAQCGRAATANSKHDAYDDDVKFSSSVQGVHMNKLIVSGFAIATLIAAPVSAADMPIAAPVPVVDNWTGFYVGASLGGRFSDSNWTTMCLNQGALGGAGCPTNLAQNASRFPLSNPAGLSSATLRPSVYLGYNWQIANWVIGAEADIAWGKSSNDIKGIPGAENLALNRSPGEDTATIKSTWDGSARARAGLLVAPNILLYATGGASWIHMEASAFCGTARPTGWCAGPVRVGSNLGTESITSTTRVGWTAGVGGEALLWSNWLMRIEYRYADYGTLDFTLFPGAGACGAGCDTITAEATLRTHTVLVGFAYKFGGPFFMQ
jgi:outer membrane immunogenic protein